MIGNVIVHLLALAMGPSDDWPSWRGPTGSGVAAQSLSPAIASPEHLTWKVEIPGRGLSSPVIVGDLVFLSTAIKAGAFAGTVNHPDMVAPSPHELIVICLNRKDGKVAWRETLGTVTPHQAMHRDASFATPTLACDGKHVAVSFGSFGTFVLTVDGKRLWDVDLGDLDILEAFGEGSSPALKDGVLVQIFDHEGESFIVGLDVENGEELWRRDRPRGTNWTTPLIVEVEGAFQVIAGAERTVAYDLHLGDEIWWLGEWPEEEPEMRPHGRIAVMSSPVASGDLVFVHRGEELGIQAVYLPDAEGDVTETDALRWTYLRDLPEVSSPLVHQDRIYLVKANQGILTALNATTGETLYGPVRLKGVVNIYASPIAAGDLVFITGRDGEVEVVQAGDEFQSVAVHRLEDRLDASPAVAGKQLFVRGHQHLYCFTN